MADLQAMVKKASLVLKDHPTHKEPDATEFAKALNLHNNQYISQLFFYMQENNKAINN